MLTETQLRRVKSLRAPRKLLMERASICSSHRTAVATGATTTDSNGKHKTLSLGVYPAVSLATARARHQEAKRLLAEGLEPPSIKKQAFGQIVHE